MSKRIKTVNFHNYRAFFNEARKVDKNTLQLNGKNLLLYGENGSGKSSVAKGLEDFFKPYLSSKEDGLAAGITTNDSFNKNIFNATIGTAKDFFIDIAFSNPDESKRYSENLVDCTNNDKWIEYTYKASGFLDYRSLLQIHYKSDPASRYNLFFGDNGILLNHKLDNGDDIEQYITRLKTDPTGINLAAAQIYITESLDKLESDTLRYLNTFFKHDLTLTLKPNLNLTDGKIKASLEIEINYANNPIPIEGFLNEARLTALAISIYLSALKKVPAPPSPAFRLLVLDDVFIGLDNSNRLPLLDILKKEFSDFQIVLATHDRAWFELAKKELEDSKWETAELYVQYATDITTIPQQQPLVINHSDDYLTKAERYFGKQGGDYLDYPACANYLRKACEQLIKDFLPYQFGYKDDGKGAMKQIDTLDELFKVLKECLDKYLLDFTPFAKYSQIIRTTLNPFSHDSANLPIYTSELQLAFELVEQLKTLSKKVILKKGDKIFFKTEYRINPKKASFFSVVSEVKTFINNNIIKKGEKILVKPATKPVTASYRATQDLVRLSQVNKKILTDINFEGLKYTKRDKTGDESNNSKDDKLLKLYVQINRYYELNDPNKTIEQLYALFENKDGKTLQQLLDE